MKKPCAIVWERGPVDFPLSGIRFGPAQLVTYNRDYDTAETLIRKCRLLGRKPLFCVYLKRVKKG